MNPSTASGSSVEEAFLVGDWLIQPRHNQISQDETVHEVEPKVMQVLVCLAQQPGVVVSHAALMETVWQGTIVGDKSLTGAISKLRKVFGDDPYRPHVIKTVSKQGYRLIAPVQHDVPLLSGSNGVAVPALPAHAVLEPISDGVATSLQPGKIWVFLAGLVVLLIGTGAFWYLRSAATPQLLPLPARVLTSYPGNEINPALSPDGKTVAFAWQGTDSGPWNIYVQAVNAQEPLQRTNHADYDLQPAWSPDGTEIAFTRYTEQDCAIYVMPTLTGEARRLTSCEGRIPAGGFAFFRPSLAWAPNGQSLVFPYRTTDAEPFSLYQLDLETLERHPLTTPPATTQGDHDPAWAPDGRTLSFTRRHGRRSADLYTYAIGSAAEQRLTFDYRSLLGHTWTPDGKHLIFSSERNGTYNLWQIPAGGGQPEWVPTRGWNVKDPVIAQSAEMPMVYENWLYTNNLWRLPLSLDATATPPQPQRLIASTLRDVHPHYSPDGTSIAFISNRSGSYEVWVADATGANPRQITALNGPIVGVPRWSPSGTHIGFEVHDQGQADLYTVSLANGHVQRLTTDPANDVLPHWSPDGRWIYFSSNRTDDWHIWRIPTATGAAERITTTGGYAAQATPDGQFIYYAKHDADGLWRMPLPQGDEQRVLSSLQQEDWGNWAISEEGVFFIERTTAPRLAFYRFATQQTEPLVNLQQAPPPHRPALSISPDGRWLLYTQLDQTENDLMVVDRFR